MNFGTKLTIAAALASSIMLAPVAALAYYPYTYFTGPNYFNAGGGFSVGANYYGSSNCSDAYGCGNIGYNAMTGQGYGMWAGGSSNYGYGNSGYGGGNNSYMQYIPANVQQYVQVGYGNYGGYGYGNSYGGYRY